MKKSVLALAMAFGVTGAFAQDLTSKKGEPYLPEAGDWSIGINANPFLNYAGNFFGKTGPNAAPAFNFLDTASNMMIVGKMFKDEKTAYRAGIRIASNTNKYNRAVNKFEKDPTATTTPAFQEASEPSVDKAKVSDRWIGISAGIEMRRGKTRLQGFYGGELAIWGGSRKEAYKYANDLTQGTTANLEADGTVSGSDALSYSAGNYTSDFASTTGTTSNVVTSIPNYSNVDGGRILKRKTNGTMGIGLRGFIGAEYFLFPKLSLAGEFGWGVGYQSNGKNKWVVDAEGTSTAAGASQEAKEIKTKDSIKSGSFVGIDTDNKNSLMGPKGELRINFYF